MLEVIKKAQEKGQQALAENEGKKVLEAIGISITKEEVVSSEEEAVALAEQIGYPVVLKGCSSEFLHKTELGLVKLNLDNSSKVKEAYQSLKKKELALDGVLVQEMVKGEREFVLGLTRDPHFGPCVMFGLGGIFTEALKDIVFRLAPLTKKEALEMIQEIKSQKLLKSFRGEEPVKVKKLAEALVSLGNLGVENEIIKEIDINPIKIKKGEPIAVDALVVLEKIKDPKD